MADQATVLAVVAVTLILISTSQFAALAVASGRASFCASRRRCLDLKGLRQSTEIARLNSDLKSSAVGNSLQWRVMEVGQVVKESEDCRSFYLFDPYRQPLPDFRPGQHVLVRPALAGAYQTTRCYSLSSAPNQRYWRITVKRQAKQSTTRRHPMQGALSCWLHDFIGPGDCLLIGGPNGQFYLPDHNVRPLVLIAAGVGITPMASMLRWSLEHTPQRPVLLCYQAKDTLHWPLGHGMQRWQSQTNACRIMSFFSRCKEEDLAQLRAELPGEYFLGRFDHTHIARLGLGGAADYFLSGPNAWMEALRAGLVEAGIEEQHIHWESFGSAINDPTSTATEAGLCLPVHFAHSQVDAAWCDPTQTLWELAREHQVEIPSGCLNGVCGCCRVKLLEGEVEYDRHISLELGQNECLTCVGRPKSACRIDA